MDRKNILKIFESRAADWIAKNPKPEGPFQVAHLPQASPGRERIVAVLKAGHEKKPIKSVLDLGCGISRWAPLFLEGLGIPKYTGVEPARALNEEALRRVPEIEGVEILLGDLLGFADKLSHFRRWDLGFTFTVLEHIPPEDIAAVAEIIKKKCRSLVAIEMTRATAAAGFCEYVFQHDYAALFGPWKFAEDVDENKTLMSWDFSK